MRHFIHSINLVSAIIDRINSTIGKAVSWLVLLMVITTFTIVVMRYLFNTGSILAQESVVYMHAILFMLAAAVTLKNDAHVRVDIFYGKMSDRKRAAVNFLGNLFMLLPVCGFIIWSSWEYVIDAWDVKEGSREAGGLPWLYLLKTIIPIFTIMLVLQGISEIVKSGRVLFCKKPVSRNVSESNLSPSNNDEKITK